MKKPLFLALVAFALSACAMAEDSFLPDGSVGHHISCGGSWLSMGDCMQKAGDICGAGGYKIYRQTGEANPYSTSSATIQESASHRGSNIAEQYNTSAGSIIQRDLFVKCNKETQ